MKKIRRVFLALSLVLLVALTILIAKAFENAENERSAAHQAVADRIFDEMERELTNFLRREENRPFEHYRASFVSPAAVSEAYSGIQEAAEPSPIAGVPSEDFVLGYFQIHPDGSFSSPHRSERGARSTDDVSDDDVDWVDGLEEVVRLVWSLENLEKVRLDEQKAHKQKLTKQVPPQKAGSTIEVVNKAKKGGIPGRGYLDSLNRASQSRRQRPSKLEQTQSYNVFSRTEPAAEADRFQEADVAEEANADFGGRRDLSQLKNQVTPGFIDVRVEPMVGRSADSELLVLYRTVAVDEKAFRQGLLINEADLVDWLARRVVTDNVLVSRVELRVDEAPESTAKPAQGYRYRRRFAEPFGSVYGLLDVQPLPELTGPAFLTTISLLLVLTAILGLFGLYRMVAVVVEFAERRHNFVSAVTHELKTPLTAIRMYGEMLRDGVIPDESKRQQYYETITSETERLTRLLQNVLELAQLEKDTRSMNLTVGDVGPVLVEVVGLLEPHARKQGFELRVDAEENLPRVRFDRDALLQVLFNLVDNALKYARKAENKEIVLRLRAKEGGVAISVTDHGPGVNREHLAKIFEPFYRGENELTRTAKGTGIGLALVRGLVERMGGRVVGKNAGAGGFEVVVSLIAATG